MTLNYGFVQIALWFQMFLWFNLYHSKIFTSDDLLERLFYTVCVLNIPILDYTQFSIGYFTTSLLIQYNFFILGATIIYRGRFNFNKSVSLAFLTVFLNSFYWEFFYHVYEFQIWMPYSFNLDWWYIRLPQWIRLLPAFFIVRNFKITDTRWLMLGLVISFILTYAKFTWRGLSLLLPINRTVALICLLYTVYISPERNRDDNDG